jgi:uncharacterized protein with gpF-like domain
LSAAKSLFLRRKQTIDWTLVERDWKNYFETEAPDNWREQFFPLLRGVTRDTNEFWTTELGIQFNVQNLFTQAALEFQAYQMQFAQPILATTEEDLFQLLRTANAEGWTIEQMNNAIRVTWEKYLDPAMELSDEEREWFEQRTPRHRIEAISRTESMKAQSFGSQLLFKEYGAERKEWQTAEDERVRDTHVAANGQIRNIDRPFEVGSSLMMYPRDGSLGAGPEEIVNCRCVSLPIVESELEQIARETGAGT